MVIFNANAYEYANHSVPWNIPFLCTMVPQQHFLRARSRFSKFKTDMGRFNSWAWKKKNTFHSFI